MKRRNIWFGVAAACAGAMCTACGHAATSAADTPAAAAAPAPASGPHPVVVDEKALGSIKIDAVHDHEQATTLAMAGKVQFDEDRVAHVLAPLAGQIVNLQVKVGDAVRKGQPLCAISSRDVASAVGEQIESHKDLDLAEKTMTMTQDLFDHRGGVEDRASAGAERSGEGALACRPDR